MSLIYNEEFKINEKDFDFSNHWTLQTIKEKSLSLEEQIFNWIGINFSEDNLIGMKQQFSICEVLSNSVDAIYFRWKLWDSMTWTIKTSILKENIRNRMNFIIEDNWIWDMRVNKSLDLNYIWNAWVWVKNITEEWWFEYEREILTNWSKTTIIF